MYTDHNPLKYFWDQSDISPRQARWIGFLAQFDLDIRYVEGTRNRVADAFSRDPDFRNLTRQISDLDAQSADQYVNMMDFESVLMLAPLLPSFSDGDTSDGDIVPIWGEGSLGKSLFKEIRDSYTTDAFATKVLNGKCRDKSYVILKELIVNTDRVNGQCASVHPKYR